MESKHRDKVRLAVAASRDSTWETGLCEQRWFASGDGKSVIE
jgi:hypothetical protein